MHGIGMCLAAYQRTGIGFKGAVQAEEAKQLTTFLASLPLANPSGQDYVIITGDFNSDPASEAISTSNPLIGASFSACA
jgi:hypothetical protein